MTGWKKRLIFILVVYFAGFATAVYFLAPSPVPYDSQICEASCASSPLSSQFIVAFNSGMHKCVDFMKDAAVRVGSFLKKKYQEKTTQAPQACNRSVTFICMNC